MNGEGFMQIKKWKIIVRHELARLLLHRGHSGEWNETGIVPDLLGGLVPGVRHSGEERERNRYPCVIPATPGILPHPEGKSVETTNNTN